MKSSKKINKKIYLLITLLTGLALGSCIIAVNNTILKGINEKDDENNRNIVIYLSVSSSITPQWNRLWGGSDSDLSKGMAVDSSENVYLAGYTESFGYIRDMVLVKYDNSGVQQWNRTWGGTNEDLGYGVAVDSSENVYLTGYTESFGAGNWDMVLVKYNSSGEQQWNRTWGGTYYDKGHGLAVDSSDNVYIAGATEILGAGIYYMILMKYDSSGVQQWYRTWGGSYDDFGNGVAVDSFDNVYVSGSTKSFGAGMGDWVLVKYDSSGVQQWNRTWGGSYDDEGMGVTVDYSDNVYVSGHTKSFGAGSYDMVLVKYNSSGVQQWNRTWGRSDYDISSGVAVDSSENVYIAGSTRSFGAGNYDMVLVKYITSIIKLNSPSQYNLFGDIPPDFNISIFESNLDTTWYTLDGGNNNITFNGLNGTIEPIEWAKQGSGMVLIRFYANDTMGGEWYVEALIFKDIDNPKIIINYPSQDEEFGGNAPNYYISITEENLESIRYTIDGGITNYTTNTFTQLYGTINQGAWDAAPYGKITIRFTAKDRMGNTESKSVTIIKVGLPVIHGYNLFILLGILSIAIIIRRYK